MMEAFEKHLLALGHRPSSVASCLSDTGQFLTWHGDGEASHMGIAAYLHHLAGLGQSRATRAHKLASLRKFHGWMQQQGLVPGQSRLKNLVLKNTVFNQPAGLSQ